MERDLKKFDGFILPGGYINLNGEITFKQRIGLINLSQTAFHYFKVADRILKEAKRIN